MANSSLPVPNLHSSPLPQVSWRYTVSPSVNVILWDTVLIDFSGINQLFDISLQFQSIKQFEVLFVLLNAKAWEKKGQFAVWPRETFTAIIYQAAKLYRRVRVKEATIPVSLAVL